MKETVICGRASTRHAPGKECSSWVYIVFRSAVFSLERATRATRARLERPGGSNIILHLRHRIKVVIR